ncbi:2'-5' RNA ligase family protein [Desmospora activa]|uniref:Putative phosphoesterase C8J48_1921 n=1 Tax=Desmospora activa DSM 45169 TaxID=1121389 RepID=A0A2T4ZBP1_9BACL|nr:2'-5' RNA ligase family protein [Desmospora activa]PTM59309.1 2'-5' RNA ligase [Desmospora activa DSM 45169]
MKYGITFFPEKKVQDLINSYRKRYDPHYAWIPPHITLKEAFDLQDDELPQAIEHLERVSQEVAPFPITLTKVSSFYPTNNVIYIALEQEDSIRRLHEKINSGMLHHESAYKFIPHITLGQKMLEDELHDVYGSLRMRRFELESNIDRFHLLYQLDNNTWSIYQTFLLRGN